MSIDSVLRYVAAGKIDLGGYDSLNVGMILPNGTIFVNENAPLDEQVMTVLHEISHMHPRFMSYTGGLWEGSLRRDESIETAIDSFAQDAYLSRPDVVAMIKDELQKAKRGNEIKQRVNEAWGASERK